MEDPYSSSDDDSQYQFASGRQVGARRRLWVKLLGGVALVALVASCLILFAANGFAFGSSGKSQRSTYVLGHGSGGASAADSGPAPGAAGGGSSVSGLGNGYEWGSEPAEPDGPIEERIDEDDTLQAQLVVALGSDTKPVPSEAEGLEVMQNGCFLNNTFFTELNGRHTMPVGGERTEEVSPEACQLRCANTKDCAHFSWWSDGGCLLTTYTAYHERFAGYGESYVICGPASCDEVRPKLAMAVAELGLEAGHLQAKFLPEEATGCGSLYSSYDLSWKAQGKTFFDDFQFCQLSETHGAEWYLNKTEAFRLGVVETTDTNAVLRVGDQIEVFKRTSVMLRSAQAWSPSQGFMVAMKYKHVPYGAGIWPAFWLMNSDYLWPRGGELDILEYANDASSKVTFHTNKNCSLAVDKLNTCMKGPNVDLEVIKSCYTNYTSNELGCKPPQVRRTGKWYADNPGVIATVWDRSGVFVFHIPEGEVPPDLSSDNPNPNSWERWMTAYLPFDPETCYDVAKPQEIVLNIALCGDWAGGAWYNSEEARATGFLPPYCVPGHVTEPATDCCTIFMSSPTAEEYLKTRAYFDIEYVKVFEPTGTTPSKISSGSFRNEGKPLEEPCVHCGGVRWIPKGSHATANVCCPSCSNATYYWNTQCQCGGTLVCGEELAPEETASE